MHRRGGLHLYLASSNLKPLQIATQKGIYICASNVDDDSLRYSSAVISMMRPETANANGRFRQNVPFALAVSVDFQSLLVVNYAP